MNGDNIWIRRQWRILLVWGVALLLLGACTAPDDGVAPPQAPQEMAGVVVDASPDAIALTRADMPAGFQLAAEKGEGPEYVALYLRPNAVDEEIAGGNSLLSVLTSVAVYTTTARAEQVYREASGSPTQQNDEDFELLSSAATDIVTEPFAGAAEGVDASEAYRVTYSLMGRRIFEYGHRIRLGNVLAYVVVAAIGDPGEPEHLLGDARDLVQRQIDHIAEAASPGTIE